jgi:orotidine-5'-phosphate decarboxylase
MDSPTPRPAPIADDRLIVGLDLPDAAAARALVATLGADVGFYKIGLGLLASGGLDLARELKASGARVFLDLKLFDIGATVTAAVRALAPLAPDFLTVHGDPHVVRSAVAGRGDAATRILAVTVLTSLDRSDLDDGMTVPGAIADIVVERARRALAAGADGVIASPREAGRLRALPEATGRLIVTPGIRPSGSAAGDQKRIATPAAALASGADHLVVARPIWTAEDPRAAAKAILAEIAGIPEPA